MSVCQSKMGQVDVDHVIEPLRQIVPQLLEVPFSADDEQVPLRPAMYEDRLTLQHDSSKHEIETTAETQLATTEERLTMAETHLATVETHLATTETHLATTETHLATTETHLGETTALVTDDNRKMVESISGPKSSTEPVEASEEPVEAYKEPAEGSVEPMEASLEPVKASMEPAETKSLTELSQISSDTLSAANVSTEPRIDTGVVIQDTLHGKDTYQ